MRHAAVLLALWMSPALGAIGLVQKAPATTAPAEANASSLNVSFAAAPAPGNLVVVFITNNSFFGANSVRMVTDNQGGTYLKALDRFVGSDGYAALYYRENVAGGSPFTVTVVANNGTNYLDVGIAEFSGVAGSGSLDGTSFQTGGNANGTCGPLTGTASEDLYVGVLTGDNSSFSTLTALQNQLWREPSNSNAVMNAEWSTGIGMQTLTWTVNTSGTWLGIGAAFKAAVTGGAFTQLQILAPGETAAPGTASGKMGTPAPQVAGAPFVVSVNACDDMWNIVPGITDTVQITSLDPAASLPVNAALVSSSMTFGVTLATVGNQTVSATDVTNALVNRHTTGPIAVIDGGAGGAGGGGGGAAGGSAGGAAGGSAGGAAGGSAGGTAGGSAGGLTTDGGAAGGTAGGGTAGGAGRRAPLALEVGCGCQHGDAALLLVGLLALQRRKQRR